MPRIGMVPTEVGSGGSKKGDRANAASVKSSAAKIMGSGGDAKMTLRQHLTKTMKQQGKKLGQY